MMTTINNHAFNHLTWKDACGYTVLDVYNEPGGPHGTDADMNATYVIPFLTLDKPGAVDAQVAMCGSGGGTDGGVPGSGGATGAGGATGVGGNSVGSGGAVGAGGAMNVGSAGDTGTGQITSGGSGGDVGTGSPGTTTGMDTTTDESAAQRPGCSCKLADASGARDGLLWGLVALSAAFVRRRRASSSADER
jgi:MYXO-CTERM domain-containing protein